MTDRLVTLDEWYRMVNSIYIDRNFYRTPDSILTHLVEVTGGLSLFASQKNKPGVDPEAFLAKALGWWMALCGKVGIRSVERIIWAKFPGVCPYCMRSPHHAPGCTRARQSARPINWEKLKEIGNDNRRRGIYPERLRDWQTMFAEIYPRGDTTNFQMNYSRLAEELGELAETVRILPVSHAYYMNEAADVFAWLMGMANQQEHQTGYRTEPGEMLEEALWLEYPGECNYCHSKVCKCPPILASTLGRLSRDMPLAAFADEEQTLFSFDEAMQYFRIGDTFVSMGTERIHVTTTLLQEMTSMSRQTLTFLKEDQVQLRGISTELSNALAKLENMASLQELSQESLDEVIAILRDLPQGPKSIIIDFLTNMTAGVWLEVLLKAIHSS